MLYTILLVFTTAVTVLNAQALTGPKHDKVIVCYVATWAVYRPGFGKFTLENLEPQLCTHIVYSFAGLDEQTNTIKSLDPWQDLEKDYGKAGYKRLVDLKESYPHLKVTLAIGGWNEGSPKYSNMASTPETREIFVKSVVKFLDTHKFDGLDLDWEYPTKREGKPYDRENFVHLVKELKDAFESKGYILTAALGAGKATMETAYDLAKLSRYLDLIHMMCYDYHGTWDGVIGANAPLYGLDDEDVLSVDYTIKYMLAHGVSPYKLVLGLPMYGRTFELMDPSTRMIEFGKTPVKSTGFKGPYTGEAGFMGYNEICEDMKNASVSWRSYWHEKSATPYLRDQNGQGERVIVYDNGRSLAKKVKVAIDQGFGGLMVWSIDTDDYRGDCPNEVDPYVDFVERYKDLVDDPLLNKALKNLHLPSARHISLTKNPAYTMEDGRLGFRLPEAKYTNYALMQTINDAISLALEEKVLLDEMAKVAAENEIDDDDKNDKGSSCTVGSSFVSVVLCLFALKYV